MYWCFSDIAIASAQTPKDISQLAREIGLSGNDVELYGKKKAKVLLTALDNLKEQKNGRYVVVAG